MCFGASDKGHRRQQEAEVEAPSRPPRRAPQELATLPEAPSLPGRWAGVVDCLERHPVGETIFTLWGSQVREKHRLASPKQPQPERERDWYPYYAGFTERFVDDVVSTYARQARTVLDPWNGAGTTTATAVKRGLGAGGVDINPALSIIARARLTPRATAGSLLPIARTMMSIAELQKPPVRAADPLTTWLRSPAASHLRSIQAAIHTTVSELPAAAYELDPTELSAQLPLVACFYYTGLFATTRDLLRRFRASNPTWLMAPASHRNRLNPAWPDIRAAFLDRVAYFSQRLVTTPSSMPADIRTVSATALPWDDKSYDAAVTSPPYATRIDYVKSTLPELAILGASLDELRRLRRLSTGSPVIDRLQALACDPRSTYALDLLEAIRTHSSKGSRSYYYPWMQRYIVSLQAGLVETARVVVDKGTIAIVVQDSYYKEVPVDLQRIVIDVFVAEGRKLIDRHDFAVRHHRVQMNPRAQRHLATRNNAESLLVFS